MPFLGIVELCAKILQIMRSDFKDYARTFRQLCAHYGYAHLLRLSNTQLMAFDSRNNTLKSLNRLTVLT